MRWRGTARSTRSKQDNDLVTRLSVENRDLPQSLQLKIATFLGKPSGKHSDLCD